MNNIKTGFPAKYVVNELKGETNDERWANLKDFFPEDRADRRNLLMGSTDGIHGTTTSLDDLEDPRPELKADFKDRGFTRDNIEAFTILIIQPRICRLTYGTIGIRSDDDMHWLRTIINESVHYFAESQEGNRL